MQYLFGDVLIDAGDTNHPTMTGALGTSSALDMPDVAIGPDNPEHSVKIANIHAGSQQRLSHNLIVRVYSFRPALQFQVFIFQLNRLLIQAEHTIIPGQQLGIGIPAPDPQFRHFSGHFQLADSTLNHALMLIVLG